MVVSRKEGLSSYCKWFAQMRHYSAIPLPECFTPLRYPVALEGFAFAFSITQLLNYSLTKFLALANSAFPAPRITLFMCWNNSLRVPASMLEWRKLLINESNVVIFAP